MKKKKKMPEGGVLSNETPQQKKARLAAIYGSRPPVEPIKTLSGFDAYVPVPTRRGYQPAPSIPKTKAALAAASLASGAGSNPYSYLLNVAGAGGDLYTGTRYLLEGQFDQAADDYLQALVGLVPGAAGRFGAKGRYLNQADKVYNAATKIAQSSSDVKTISEMEEGGTIASTHNNPGNMMYSGWQKKYGATKGKARFIKGKPAGHYAKFPDVQSGQTAMFNLFTGDSYKNRTVQDAVLRWTGEGVYNTLPKEILNKKISKLNNEELAGFLDAVTRGEDSKTYAWNIPDSYQPNVVPYPQNIPISNNVLSFDKGGSLSPSKAKEMLRDGTANGKKLTAKQKRYFGYIAGGGKADNGASISQISDNMHSNPMIQFNGPSHEEGGIPIEYAGQPVEVEGAETGFIDGAGDLNVFGNLKVPGTNQKFKNVGKQIAKQEKKASSQMDKSMKLINKSDPYDTFERLKFNSGMLMAQGAYRKQEDLTEAKEGLAMLQQLMLEQDLAKFNDGGMIKAANGYSSDQDKPKKKQTLAERHNNPGNLMYADWEQQYGAVKGQPRYDKKGKLVGYYAQFPDVKSGQAAMKNLLLSPSYQNLTLEQASNKWTGEGPYKNLPKELRNTRLNEMTPDEFSKTLDIFTIGEDSKEYNWEGVDAPTNPTSRAQIINRVRTNPQDPTAVSQVSPPVVPYKDLNRIPTAPTPGFAPPSTAIRPNVPSSIPAGPTLTPVPQEPKPTFGMSRVPWGELVPEIAALFDEPDFVPGQRFDPQLYQPYQVSFQDRLNENNASFRAATSQMGNNPAAVSVLAGQKYQADSQVLADEFRTNQGITNDITNKNISLLNEAQLKNLQLADTQFVRQEQAKSNTRQNIFNAASSISDKIRRTAVEDRQYNAVSSMFPQYTFDRYGNLVYIPNTQQSFSPAGGTGATGSPDSYYQRTREEYGPNQQLRKTIINTPSDAEKTRIDYQNWNNALKQKATLSSYYRANPLGRH